MAAFAAGGGSIAKPGSASDAEVSWGGALTAKKAAHRRNFHDVLEGLSGHSGDLLGELMSEFDAYRREEEIPRELLEAPLPCLAERAPAADIKIAALRDALINMDKLHGSWSSHKAEKEHELGQCLDFRESLPYFRRALLIYTKIENPDMACAALGDLVDSWLIWVYHLSRHESAVSHGHARLDGFSETGSVAGSVAGSAFGNVAPAGTLASAGKYGKTILSLVSSTRHIFLNFLVPRATEPEPEPEEDDDDESSEVSDDSGPGSSEDEDWSDDESAMKKYRRQRQMRRVLGKLPLKLRFLRKEAKDAVVDEKEEGKKAGGSSAKETRKQRVDRERKEKEAEKEAQKKAEEEAAAAAKAAGTSIEHERRRSRERRLRQETAAANSAKALEQLRKVQHAVRRAQAIVIHGLGLLYHAAGRYEQATAKYKAVLDAAEAYRVKMAETVAARNPSSQQGGGEGGLNGQMNFYSDLLEDDHLVLLQRCLLRSIHEYGIHDMEPTTASDHDDDDDLSDDPDGSQAHQDLMNQSKARMAAQRQAEAYRKAREKRRGPVEHTGWKSKASLMNFVNHTHRMQRTRAQNAQDTTWQVPSIWATLGCSKARSGGGKPSEKP